RLLLCFVLLLHAPPPPALSPLSLHDALPICTVAARPRWQWCGERAQAADRREGGPRAAGRRGVRARHLRAARGGARDAQVRAGRSEEHTSELQSRGHLVCRLLLEKKKQNSKA